MHFQSTRFKDSGTGLRRFASTLPLYVPSAADFANVKALLHFDGTNGANTAADFVDQITKVWTPHGSVSLTTSRKVFGSAALAVVGGGDHYIDTPSIAGLQLGGGGDFTIEAWVVPTALSSTWNVICQKDYVSGSSYWSYAFALYNGKVRLYTGSGVDTSPPQALDGATTATLNAPNHCVAQRRGGLYEVYLNGIRDGFVAVSTPVGNATEPLRIGGFGDGGTSSFAGSIDEFRITKGAALYTGNFTPPTAPFPDS